MINHPASRAQIIEEDSILRIMLREGFVRVLSRSPHPDHFLEYPETMARSGNSSFHNTTQSKEWPDVKESLRHVSKLIYSRKFVQPWPNREMHIGFHNIISRIFNKTHDDLGIEKGRNLNLDALQSAYIAQNPTEKNPRDAFEKAVVSLSSTLGDPFGACVEFMNIANQAYHYNFAMCLSDEISEPVVADTSVGLAFEDLLGLDDTVETEIQNLPLIDIPQKVISSRGINYTSLLDPSTKVGGAKNHFLTQIDQFFSARNLTDLDRKKAISDASDEYRNRLAEYFSRQGVALVPDNFWANRLETTLSIGIDQVGDGIRSAVGIADYAGLAVNILADPLKKRFEEFILRPLRRRITKNTLNPVGEEKDGYLRFRLKDIRPRFASLAFNPEKIAEHIREIPRRVPQPPQ